MIRRICPRCGSRNTAAILWGMPAMTPELQEKLAKKEIVLGGCCITTSDPTHHCNKCNKDFGGAYFPTPALVKELTFFLGGYFGPSHWVCLNADTAERVLKYAYSCDGGNVNLKTEVGGEGAEILRVPLGDRWFEFSRDLLRCYFIDWKRTYSNNHILDGTQWSLEVVFTNGKRIMRSGSNAFPPHWKKLIALFKKYGLPHMR